MISCYPSIPLKASFKIGKNFAAFPMDKVDQLWANRGHTAGGLMSNDSSEVNQSKDEHQVLSYIYGYQFLFPCWFGNLDQLW